MTFHYLRRLPKGFTLIEMLIVIAIISILTVISITTFQGSQKRSRDVGRKSQVLKIQSSLEQYKSANNSYGPDYATNAGAAVVGAACAVNTQLGGYFVVSTDASASLDPMFVQTAGALAPYTGYLLRYMERPSYVPANLSDAPFDTDLFRECTLTGTGIAIKTGRINYAVYNNQYWIQIALENKGESRAPKSVTCYHNTLAPAAANAAIEFHDIVYPAFSTYPIPPASSCDGTQYKIFARGSLAQLSQ